MKYTTIASTFSGNKGAASMLEASIQTINEQDKNATFTVLTIYPEQDKKFNSYKNTSLLGAKPLFLAAALNPLALLYKLLPPLRGLLKKQKHIRAIAEADVFLDEGGITFVDGRTKFIIYNVVTILPALLMGTRVVKCSQAMGPFSGVNKFASKLILPKVDTICARGPLTHEYLQSLNLNNVVESTDYAFLMDISKGEATRANSILQENNVSGSKSKKLVAIMPSEVVRKKAESKGQDYIAYNAEFIKYLLNEGYRVLLMAYSARQGTDARHNNDLPVCRQIAQEINDKKLTFIDEELSAQQLRHIIGETDAVVTSRFHAMIAALSMEVPPLVVGWSHKYAEIMEMFKMDDVTLGSNDLDQDKLQVTFDNFMKNNSKHRQSIKKHLPEVKKNAQRQVMIICKS